MVAPVGIISHKLAQIAGFNFVLTEKRGMTALGPCLALFDCNAVSLIRRVLTGWPWWLLRNLAFQVERTYCACNPLHRLVERIHIENVS